ncbi:MAG: hypothetical protein E7312_09005 [Clostridiales bacterium]|nr:hypothetical protein [Clostridiales bacterium]
MPEQLADLLPFLIPLILIEYALFGYSLYHVLSHKTYKRGSRKLWLIVVIAGMQFIGPILYLILGKEEY